jgi:hypothetical protein
MTATDERTPLAVVPTETVELIRGGKTLSVSELAALLAAPAAPGEVTAAKLPKPSRLPDAAKVALERLPEVFSTFTLTEPRPLSAQERADLTREAVTISEITGPLKDRLEQIKALIEVHLDETAPEGTPLITTGKHAGHALRAEPEQPFEVQVPGFEQPWKQQYTKGSTEPQMARLQDLLVQGKITRDEFLACTSVPDVPRQLDEAKIGKLVRKDPQRGLEILAAISVTSAPTASIVSPKK